MLQKVCPECSCSIKERALFCHLCGTRLTMIGEDIQPDRLDLSVMRRLLIELGFEGVSLMNAEGERLSRGSNVANATSVMIRDCFRGKSGERVLDFDVRATLPQSYDAEGSGMLANMLLVTHFAATRKGWLWSGTWPPWEPVNSANEASICGGCFFSMHSSGRGVVTVFWSVPFIGPITREGLREVFGAFRDLGVALCLHALMEEIALAPLPLI